MVRVKTLCGHEVRLQEHHMITFSIKSHRHEPDEDQEELSVLWHWKIARKPSYQSKQPENSLLLNETQEKHTVIFSNSLHLLSFWLDTPKES